MAILISVSLAVTLLIVTALHGGNQAGTSPEIIASYSSSYTNTLGGLQPQSGNTFLVVHLTIENKGYTNFTANPFSYMYVEVNGKNYNVSSAYIFLSNPFPPSNLNNTQSATGDVVFEVPQGSNSFAPEWRLSAGTQIRLDWKPV